VALTVRDIMEVDVPAIYPEDPIDTMRDNELPGIPVINEGGRCVGIITEADLVMREERSDLHLPHVIELRGGAVFLESRTKFGERLRKAIGWLAPDVMTEEPITIHPDPTVGEAAPDKHNRLPVVEHGRLVGVVTRIDVLDALVEP
jgi:CBS-domain-containing membrane protein